MKNRLEMKFRKALIILFLFTQLLLACNFSQKEITAEIKKEVHTLKIVTPTERSAGAIYKFVDYFSKKHPDISLDVSVVPRNIPANIFLTSKFIVGDIPDILLYQPGNSTGLYAREGYLLNLDNMDSGNRFFPGTEESCRYQGKLYALPVDITVSGLFVQMSTLWRGAVRLSNFRIVPETFDEFLLVCQNLREAGIQYPIVMSASHDDDASLFLFQYIHQNIYDNNPDFYTEMLNGKHKWTDSKFREMYRYYEEIRRYINSDAIRIDRNEAMRRFANAEAAFYIGTSKDVSGFRQYKNNLDMLFVTPPWVNDTSKALPLSEVDMVISGSNMTNYPDNVKSFLGEFTSVSGADIYSQTAGSISAVLDSTLWYDSCLGPQKELFKNGRFMKFIFRDWLPGFESVFMRLNQLYFAGMPADSILSEMEETHRRMVLSGGLQ